MFIFTIIIRSNFNVLYNATLTHLMAQELLMSLFNVCPSNMSGQLGILWVSSNKQCHPSEPRKHAIYVTVPALEMIFSLRYVSLPSWKVLKTWLFSQLWLGQLESTLNMFAWGSVVDWICSLVLYLLFIILFILYILPYLVLL